MPPSLQLISLLCINSFQLRVPDIDNSSKLFCIFVWARFGSINTLLCSPGEKETFIQSCLTRCLPLSSAPFFSICTNLFSWFLDCYCIIISLSSSVHAKTFQMILCSFWSSPLPSHLSNWNSVVNFLNYSIIFSESYTKRNLQIIMHTHRICVALFCPDPVLWWFLCIIIVLLLIIMIITLSHYDALQRNSDILFCNFFSFHLSIIC